MAIAGKALDRLPLPRLGAIAGDSESAELDLGDIAARVALRAGRPDRDLRHQPARPAWPTNGPMAARPFRRGPAWAGAPKSRICRQATTCEAIDAAYAEAEATKGRPSVVIARTIRQGREGGGEPGGLARQGHRRPGSRNRGAAAGCGTSSWTSPSPAAASRMCSTARCGLPRSEVGSGQWRRGRRTARRSRPSARRSTVVAVDGREDLELDLPQCSGGAAEAVLRDVHRRQARSRPPPRSGCGARLPRLRIVRSQRSTRRYDFVHGRDQRRRSAFRIPCWDLDGEDGPSQMAFEDIATMRAVHGSTVLHPCDGTRR